MTSWAKPTDELIERALGTIARPEYARDFFERLDNPEWIEPLRKHHYFDTPPSRVVEDEGRTISLPRWPVSRYLVRMAASAPEYATAIQAALLDIPETENDAVHEDVIAAAAKLPGNLAKPIAEREANWLRKVDHVFGLAGQSIPPLIVTLAHAQQGATALELARRVLRVRVDEKTGNVVGKVDSYDYEKIIEETLPALVAADPRESLLVFCRLLTYVLDHKKSVGTAPHDYSYIWHKHIDVDDNPGDSIEGILVSAVRDTALESIRLDSKRLPDMVKVLKEQRWIVFRRIALFLLARYWKEVPDLARPEVLDRANFDEGMIRREYDALVHEVLCNLDDADRTIYFGWVTSGPDLEAHRRFIRQWGDATTNEEDALQAYASAWRRDRLVSVVQCVPDDLKSLAADLPQFGLDPEDEIERITATWMESPLKADELEQLSVPDLASRLKTWTPAPEDLTARIELGRELEKVIASKPDVFSAAADEFKTLHPTYARSLIEGLDAAVRTGTPIDWQQALAFSRWIVSAKYDGTAEQQGLTDPDYSWSRNAVMRLLQDGFRATKPVKVPDAQASAAWEIIRVVSDDPDPARNEPLPMNTDPSTHALNTNRGQALHTLIGYIVWLRNSVGVEAFQGHSTLPDVEAVLTEHLSPEEAPAILSIYGQYFPWLLKFLPDWTNQHVHDIFTTETGNRLWSYTWPAYLIFCGAYNDIYAAIADKYLFASHNPFGSEEVWQSLASPAKKLAEHVTVLYARGVVGVNDALFTQAIVTAPSDLRGHVVWFANNLLKTDDEWATPEVIERFQTLWDQYLSVREDQDLRAFGWFALSAAFPPTWFLERLIRALERVKAISGEHWVIERLAATARDQPLLSIRALLLILQTTTDGAGPYAWGDEITAIIQFAVSSDDEAAQRTVAEVVNTLGRLGFKKYRALLPR
ncbi:MAG TPA: hypothetical protein VNA69_18625 [Thermoanaerobaculia bacterium]|nr:hypothetical protein [Thermoanaerobaculia bacterium]